MAIFNNMTITNKGQVLYAKAQAGQELHFTKMMVGSGNLDTRNPVTLIALIEPKFDIGIQEITPNTELKTATISGTINNSGVTEATYICEIGLFAEDPDEGEILYAYGTAGQYGDYYAPESMGPFSWNYQINAAIGNAANVTVELSNLTYDYGVFNTNTTFLVISGGNQKEINKCIDKKLSEITTQQNNLTNDSYPIVEATGANAYVGSSARIKTVGKGTRCTLFVGKDATSNCSLNLNSSGAASIKDSNGNVVTNLKAGIPYNLCHNGSDFILQGKGGGGNLIPKYLLTDYYGEGDNGRVDGTMINRGAPNTALNCGGTYNLQEGYYSGGKITANSIATQMANAGVTLTSASQLINGIKAYSKTGDLLTGTATLESLGGKKFYLGTKTHTFAKGDTNECTVSLGFKPTTVIMNPHTDNWIFSRSTDVTWFTGGWDDSHPSSSSSYSPYDRITEITDDGFVYRNGDNLKTYSTETTLTMDILAIG